MENIYLKLAHQGHRVPIATDLILHERDDPKTVLLDGERLGDVVIETADRFGTPLAIPLMDLRVEKEAILTTMGIRAEEIPSYHFDEPPQAVDQIISTPRMEATCASIARVAEVQSLLPMGMCIGPFSLMTKMVSDPITPVYMAGTGLKADEDEDVDTVEQCLQLGLHAILQYIEAQIDAGARAMMVCEPAANMVYFSPNQLAQSFSIFDRYVMDGLNQIRDLLARRGVDFILHDCGELIDGMVRRFGDLEPTMLSLGCSRNLWDDARLLPKDVVLYGNLPSKRFYAKDLTPSQVESAACEMLSRMRAANHPFILGSECDILSVSGSEAEIMSKVEAFMRMK